jgi:hypothetical protein
MNTRQTGDLPAPLEGVRRRFVQWRTTHQARARIPDRLWIAAVKMAGTYGLHRTARALRVEYYALKKRVEQHAEVIQGRRESGSMATFVEWSPPADHGRPSADGVRAVPAGACACTLELEDADGSKMRVHLKAATPPDLAALCQSFWNPAS